MSNVILIENDDQLIDLENVKTPIIVDFFANWCGPCKMFAPTFDGLADDHADKATFVKVNVDTTTLHQRLGIRGIPTIAIFEDINDAPRSMFGAGNPIQAREKILEAINGSNS